jgi:hypothetical protein
MVHAFVANAADGLVTVALREADGDRRTKGKYGNGPSESGPGLLLHK